MGSGFAIDAVKQVKQNLSLRGRSKEIYFKSQEFIKRKRNSLHYQKIDLNDIKRVRQKMEDQKLKDLKLSIGVGFSLLLLLIYFTLDLFFF